MAEIKKLCALLWLPFTPNVVVQAPRKSQIPSALILGPPHSAQWCSLKRCGQQQDLKLYICPSSRYQVVKFKNMVNGI